MRSALLRSASVIAFMSEICETVVITTKDGPVRVNKSDYDADQEGDKKMTLASKKANTDNSNEPVMTGTTPVEKQVATNVPPAPSAPALPNVVAPSAPSADTLFVVREGTAKTPVFFVADAQGKHIEDKADVNKDGYGTEDEAWTAIRNVQKQPFEQGQNPPPNMPEAAPAQ